MRPFRALVAAALLVSFGLGCSQATSGRPANAPPPSEDKPLPGKPQGFNGGPKQRTAN
jgi:hypothetical protein